MTLAFRTLHRPDDGSESEVPGLPPDGAVPVAVLVADGSASGYPSFPVAAVAPGTYAATDVPVGRYFLRLERGTILRQDDPLDPFVSARSVELVPLVRGEPDLSTVLAARPDLARASGAETPVTAEVTNLEPWTSGAAVRAVSAQADVRKVLDFAFPEPSPGATSHAFTFDWSVDATIRRPPGLPDAAKGDVVFWYQRISEPASGGTASGVARSATRYARVDTMHVQDGAASSVSVPLVAAPRTGSISVSARGGSFAALAAEVSPSAEPLGMSVFVNAVPRSVTWPDLPDGPIASLFVLDSDASSDVSFGGFTYGRFLEPRWVEYRGVSYSYRVRYSARVGATAVVSVREPTSVPQVLPATPVLGPPRAPRINGGDAFAVTYAVGTQPVLSWSPPAIGTATSYVVSITAFAGLPDGEIGEVVATVRGATSFRVPPGLLRSGVLYYARITARSAPWDAAAHPPFRRGYPIAEADCLTAAFGP